MESSQFTIKDLENLSGIKAHTIRIWEQRYNFLKPSRTDTNIRYYNNDELKTILNVSLLNKYGFKVSHINKLSVDELQQKILSLNQAEAQQERLVNELLQYMVNLQLNEFDNVLESTIASKGIHKTITYLIFPFLEKVGILWLTNHINPAQEHLITNIIRQKILVAIEKLAKPLTPKNTVLLFLPENEYHEIGLLYVYYLLKQQGVNTIYLGAAVPIKDLEFVNNKLKPNYIYTHITSVPKNFNLEKFLNTLEAYLPNSKLLISGFLAKSEVTPPKNIQFLPTFFSVTDFISTI